MSITDSPTAVDHIDASSHGHEQDPETEAVDLEVLVEEISIDGMCGVY